jgi:hypothetical protein
LPIAKLGGRLGNQLFQIAVAYAIATNRRVPLLIDGKDLREADLRALEAWTGPLRPASSSEISRTQGSASAAGKLRRLSQRLLPGRWRSWRLQTSCRFDASVLRSRGSVYLDGYWQNRGYVERHGDEIRSLLRFRGRLDAGQQQTLTQCQSAGTVSMHVRRGDMVGQAGFQTLGAEYYGRALTQLKAETNVTRVFVFSDDPAWCQKNLSLPDGSVVLEGNSPEVDLFLMSQCHHHVLSASTYSWWGAWLGTKDGTRVIVPATWFESYGQTPPLDEIYPPEWTRISL